MSRRPPNPAAERAAQNQATIKSLLKLETNKICADCKRNKHPRWASWNLGVFICIRCSGIHRGMGTHISRVKSVDLDSWTDEQLQSVLSWGNARANKYWESKLAAGHAPSEAKIENFIRTKYELKRWVMDGPMPDPATLDAEADDDIPLSLVKEKQSIDRKESVRKASLGQSSAPTSIRRAPAAPAPEQDLIGGDPIPVRANSAGPAMSKVPSKGEPAPPKTTSTKDSLLGLDFLGTETVAPPRPSSTTGTGGAGGQSRPDLKQSILSLYATAPRPQQQAPQGSFGGMNSPPLQQQQQQQQSQGAGAFGGMNDAFSSLSFNTTSSAPKSPPASDAFASLGGMSSTRSPPPQQTSNASAFSGLGGGNFFDTKPAQTHQQKSSFGNSSGFGGLTSPSATTTSAAQAKPAGASMPASAALGDLFDFSTPAQTSTPKPSAAPAPTSDSVFNLSASTQVKSPPATSNPTSTMGSSNWSNSDVWGANDAWSTPEAAAAPAKSTTTTMPSGSSDAFGGWGSSSGGGLASQSIVPGASGGFQPKVAADEEFGGWASSTGTGNASGGTGKPAAGFGGNDDLFSNVWQ
ncbi:hypothetical protein MCOR25_006292 [Pyricularia grisea]|uniref:Arf-GAP domain-containing protein n=1 Tax=Pyricularia grisea TaxID=148305 RepID=A0A6P8BIW9_PYRGI|nr:uncharacterized protein PgNI_01360 [Pyricularia grisea]KAI6362220.1 hypothetical protein MCOR25_006292 [Pyricularia grisea]TLD16594.1 hypothetical protein PgNI_01360 [Pyricularia grisea]